MAKRKGRRSVVEEIVWECQKHKVKAGSRCWQCRDQGELFGIEDVLTPAQRAWRKTQRSG